ncbi:TPA: hypothetical protein MFN52_005239 [Klebsiella quasipneumoniae subsp. similipneumoniae]|nr:hypothetical protein [Klebsiella quasipneumoniae subsp. similipneumoniae]
MMAISFSPYIKITDFKLSSVMPMYSNQSWTGVEIRRSTGIQYYTIEFNLNFEIANKKEVLAFISEYQQGKPFQFNMGHFSIYNGSQSGAVSCTSTANRGSLNINMSSNTLEIGTMIQFSNHKKIYQIIAKNGNTVTLFPQLRQNVQNGESVFYNNLVIEAKLDVDQDFAMNSTMITSVQIKATENL